MQGWGKEVGGAVGNRNLCAQSGEGSDLWGDDKEDDEKDTNGQMGLHVESTPD